MSWILLVEVLILSALALCAIVPRPPDSVDLLPRSAISPALSFSANSSFVNSNSSFGNSLKYECDPVRYGRNLNIRNCRGVFDYIAQDNLPTHFAYRTSDQPHDLSLPFRTTNNNGRCYVQPVLAAGATIALATPREVNIAGYTLFQECVVKRGTGGVAGDIGGDNKLNVIIASYLPDIRCNSFASPPWSSCTSIFSDMQADKIRQTFGRLPDRRVRVGLPITLTAADRRCTVKIDIKGEPTGLSWYEVWEAIVALASVCVRGRQNGGKAASLGLGRNIFLQLSDENPGGLSRPMPAHGTNASLLTVGSDLVV